MPITAGDFVRLINDPGRTGTFTGRSRSRGERVFHQVRFAEGASYIPEHELELVNNEERDLYELIRLGRYGSVNDLRRNLTHIQLTGKLANLVYSMDTTNTEFYAYQFKPILSFLESPSNGLLIADEVGLGKTIEAGLIWTEIRARFDARRLLVVCPAMLREKWRSELAKRFSIQAEILDATGLLKELERNKESVPDGRAFICSMQSIRPPKGWKDENKDRSSARLAARLDEAAEDDSLIDMVIIDESHYLRNPGTQVAALGRLLRDVADHMVLLSATPINLAEEDLFNQLTLVDPDFFEHSDSFPQVLRANEPLVRARECALNTHAKMEDVMACLDEAAGHEVLADNGQLAALRNGGVSESTLADDASRVRLANRIERINLLSHAVSRTRKRDVHELRVVREPKAYFVDMNPHEREVYQLVTETIQDYAEEADISSGFLLAGPQRRVSSCVYAAVKSWASESHFGQQDIYEDFGVDIGERQDRPLRQRLIHQVVPHVDLNALRQCDSKYEEFRRVVGEYFRENTDQKIVVFSYYPGTLEYLRERLEEDGMRSVVLHGSVKKPKDVVIAEFREDSQCQLLLSSEVASEGVDLQFCRVLVNYDLPWNPMKVEQRIGRIDRIGQKSDKVSVLNLGHKNTIDHRIYERLMLRLDIFVRALGGMESVLGEHIHDLTLDLFSSRLTAEQQEARIEQTTKAVEQIKQQQDALEKQASHMIAHSGYILEQVQAAHDFKKRITSEDLVVYVKDYLDRYYNGHMFHQIADNQLDFTVKLPPDLSAALDEFMRRYRLYGQTSLATGNTMLCRFKNKLLPPSRKEETVSQFHPLIRFISEDLRSRDEAYYPLVAISLRRALANENASPEVARSVPSGVYAFAVHRWSFSGLKQDEQLQVRVISLDGGSELGSDASFDLLNRARVEGGAWLSASNELDAEEVSGAIDNCIDLLRRDFEQAATDKKLDNSDRVKYQITAAKRHRNRQLEIQESVLMRHRMRGAQRMIPAVEGKISKIKDRFSAREGKLQQKIKLEYSSFDVCFGILRLHEG